VLGQASRLGTCDTLTECQERGRRGFRGWKSRPRRRARRCGSRRSRRIVTVNEDSSSTIRDEARLVVRPELWRTRNGPARGGTEPSSWRHTSSEGRRLNNIVAAGWLQRSVLTSAR
jgi:hypothetical protein